MSKFVLIFFPRNNGKFEHLSKLSILSIQKGRMLCGAICVFRICFIKYIETCLIFLKYDIKLHHKLENVCDTKRDNLSLHLLIKSVFKTTSCKSAISH